MFGQFIKINKFQLGLLNFLCVIPYRYVRDNDCLIFTKNSTKCRFVFYLLNIYVISIVTNLLLTFNSEYNSAESKALSLVFLEVYISSLSFRYVFVLREAALLCFSAWFQNFEHKCLKVKKEKTEVRCKVFIVMGLFSTVTMPALIVMMILRDPCKPPFLEYMFWKSKLDGICYQPAWYIRATVLSMEWYILTYFCGISAFTIFNYFYVGIRCLKFYVKEIHLLSYSPLKAFQFYRKIRILNVIYNEIMQDLLIPTIIQGSSVCVAISAYVCVKLHTKIAMPGFAFFPLLLVDSLCVMFVLKECSDVRTESHKFLKRSKHDSEIMKSRYFSRKLRSLREMRIHFGPSNYIENQTPFNCIHFSLTNSANWMLFT